MYKLVACDTDSIKICREDGNLMTEDEMDLLLNKMNDSTPKLINLEKDGYYNRFLVIKSKNYVTDDGKKIKYKGSSIMDTKKEPALKEFMLKVINAIMDNKKEDIPQLYLSYIKEALNIQDINRWTVKKTITKSVLESERTNESKVRDALNGITVQEGDKVWLYESIDGEVQASAKGELSFYKDGTPKMIPNFILKTADKWNKDENKLHYVERIYNTLCILENVVDIANFIPYHKKKFQNLLESL